MKTAVLTVLGLVIAAVTAITLNFVGVFAFQSSDGRAVSADISASLSNRFDSNVRVTCPRKIPMKKGGIEDCEANAGRGTASVRVVQDDSHGHYHFFVTDPDVLLPAADDDSADEPNASGSAVRSSFLSGCNDSFGGGPAMCQCAYDALRAESSARLPAIARAVAAKEPLDDDVYRVIENCGGTTD